MPHRQRPPTQGLFVSSSRLLDNEYQNAGSPRLLFANVYCSTPANGDVAQIYACTLATSPCDVGIRHRAGIGEGGIAGQKISVEVSTLIPPYYYYQIKTNLGGTGVVTKLYWDEVQL